MPDWLPYLILSLAAMLAVSVGCVVGAAAARGAEIRPPRLRRGSPETDMLEERDKLLAGAPEPVDDDLDDED